MPRRFPRRPASAVTAALLSLTGTLVSTAPAEAAADRIRLGSTADVSRTGWNGPAFTMNGDGTVVAASMTRAIDAIRGGTGTLDVVVLAGSAPSSGSRTPECDTVMRLAGVNSCTTWTLTSAADADGAAVNTDIRNAEFVFFAGGDQCRYARWKGTALEASVESVVAKAGGAGGGSAGHHINSPVVYDACAGGVTTAEALADPYDPALTFTTGMFEWPSCTGVVNDSHFSARDRMGRTMAFVARAVKDGLAPGGRAWGVGVDEKASLFVDKNGLGTQYGGDAYVVLGDHQPEQATPGKPLTYSGYKIWRLAPGATYDFADRPACGYYRRSVTRGVVDANLYDGTPESCAPGTTVLNESEPNDSRTSADDATALVRPATLDGTLHSSSDRDYYRITLASGGTAAVHCDTPSASDADLYLLDAEGRTLQRSVDDGSGSDEAVTFTRTASGTGTYSVDFEACSGSGEAGYGCTLRQS
ncbi:pre-peptidase C-terminal domain-containing protein [Streptomyces sp. NPDC051051]|uniref:pre-peptidase C-terminal domain-containing protein n=1 Tax=Streptomyces sp. NPDC051051 TaxID=3155666 RepID=UPI00342527C8